MITFNKTCAHYMWVIAETILQDGTVHGLTLWRQWMAPKRGCGEGCMFGLEGCKQVCSHCLEGRLRTINLYHPAPTQMDCVYLRAADVLKDWSNGRTQANPTAFQV